MELVNKKQNIAFKKGFKHSRQIATSTDKICPDY